LTKFFISIKSKIEGPHPSPKKKGVKKNRVIKFFDLRPDFCGPSLFYYFIFLYSKGAVKSPLWKTIGIIGYQIILVSFDALEYA